MAPGPMTDWTEKNRAREAMLKAVPILNHDRYCALRLWYETWVLYRPAGADIGQTDWGDPPPCNHERGCPTRPLATPFEGVRFQDEAGREQSHCQNCGRVIYYGYACSVANTWRHADDDRISCLPPVTR